MQQSREHTLKAFDEDLDRLRALITEMGGLAEHAITEAMRCLTERDIEGAARVVRDDKKLDVLEIETERRTVQLIALRAPMAGDLRDVVACVQHVQLHLLLPRDWRFLTTRDDPSARYGAFATRM